MGTFALPLSIYPGVPNAATMSKSHCHVGCRLRIHPVWLRAVG
jgi:hypothetical protein